jgi:hypothetical protein
MHPTLAHLSPEAACWLADALLIVHGSFIAWAVLGAFAVLRWPGLAWLHLPALAWAVWISATAGICPLTAWEWALRERAGQGGFGGGFIEHYLVRWIYPEGLTPSHQAWMALGLATLNALVYARIIWAWRQRNLPQRS